MLIKTIEEIRELLPVSLASDFNKLKPHLANAERDYLVPAIGDNMILELEEFAETPPAGELTEVQESMKELLDLARISLIHLAYWIGYDTLNAHISDGGFRRIESDKIRSLFKYQEDSIRDYFKVTGYNGLDAMLELMETKPDHFLEYYASKAYTERKELFVKDTQSFHNIYFIGKSRLIFMRLIPYMKTVADLYIKPLLGTTNYEMLKTEMVSGTPSAAVRALLPLLEKPVVFLSTAMLMEDSGAELNDRGLFFAGKMATNLDNTVHTPAETERVNALVKRNRAIGESYLAAVKTHLLENAADWNGYASPKGILPNRDNTGKRSVWA